MRLLFQWTWVLLLSVHSTISVCPPMSQCTTTPGNIARHRNITASSTCVVGMCSNATTSHGIENINDGDATTFWESETFEPVTVQLNLDAAMIFESTEIRWESSVPESFVIERSSDSGQTWTPYMFFSASCARFNLTTRRSVEGSPNTTEAVCFSEESQVMSNDIITFSVSDQVAPGVLSPQEMIDYQTITNLRLRLFSRFLLNQGEGFAIKEWSVTGTCMCNGHGACDTSTGLPDFISSTCVCSHNTAGNHCEMCEALYNNAPWMPANESSANACEMCVCMNHSSSCAYDASLGQGRCDCADSTAGVMCEACQSGFYMNPVVPQTAPDVCLACNCDLAGTRDRSIECTMSGECNCKDNVEQAQCSRCKMGFFNLTDANPVGCQPCDCDADGLVDCDSSGVCMCRENVIGSRCDECADGFTGTPSSCLPCGCNPVGSSSSFCDKTSGECPCIAGATGSQCRTLVPGWFVRDLDSIRFEAETSELSFLASVLLPEPDAGLLYTGRGLASLQAGGALNLSFSVETSSIYEVIIRYTAYGTNVSADLQLTSENGGLACSDSNSSTAVVSPSTPFPQGTNAHLVFADTVCLTAGQMYTLSMVNLQGNLLIDSIVLLPWFVNTSLHLGTFDVNQMEVCLPRTIQVSASPLCTDIFFTLSVEFFSGPFLCNCSSEASLPMDCMPFGGACACKMGVGGDRCDSCLNGFYNLTGSGCSECGCNPTGSESAVCGLTAGQCTCRPGVQGRTCSACLETHSNFSLSGCTACDCTSLTTSPGCTDEGVCACLASVAGDKCDRCGSGFFNLTNSGCTQCTCDTVGTASNDCNMASGQCPCKGGAVGLDCSECPPEHYRTAGTVRMVCEACRCSGKTQVCVGDETNYSLGSILHNFTEPCSATREVCELGWTLVDTTTNMTVPFVTRDNNGLLYITVSETSRFFAPSTFLGNRLSSYGRMFSVWFSLTDIAMPLPVSVYLRGSKSPDYLVANMSITDLGNDSFNFMVELSEGFWYNGSLQGSPATYTDLLTVLSDLTELSFTAHWTGDHMLGSTYLEAVELEEIVMSPPLDGSSAFPVEVCACPANYTGTSCQQCSPGYYRPSMHLGGACIACQCNNLAQTCHLDTGVCIDCTGNATGNNCETCLPGFYGDPTRRIPCRACECVGPAFNNTCSLDDSDMPQCMCEVGYTGRYCEACQEGLFGNPTTGICNNCSCNGNVDPSLGPTCDSTTGMCLNCQNNTTGPRCNECLKNYYGNPFSGSCMPCDCHVNGTNVCDIVTGACNCRANVEGPTCETCLPNHWGLHLGVAEGCLPCSCCANGSVSPQCNNATGQCPCRSGVGSPVADQKCCQCTPGFFGLGAAGCTACGCSNGSLSMECDQVTGNCPCQEGAVGAKCDDCGPGYEGRIPSCIRCHDCYFSLNTSLYATLDVVAQELSRVAELELYYGNQTLAQVEAALSILYSQLGSISGNLSQIVVMDSDIDALNTTLMQIQSSMRSLSSRVVSITEFVNLTISQLEDTYSYDLNSLEQMAITFANNASNQLMMAMVYETRAQIAYQSVQMAYMSALEQWQVSRQAESNVTQSLVALQTAITQSRSVEADIQAFMMAFTQNQMALSNVSMSLMITSDLINTLIVLLTTENAVVDDVFTSVMNLTELYMGRYMEVLNLLDDVTSLMPVAQRASTLAAQASASAQSLLALSQNLANLSQVLMTRSSNISSTINSASLTARDSNSTAYQALAQSIPSLSAATDVARRINQSAVNETTISEIFTTAESSRNLSESVLALAQNASDLATGAEAMVGSVESHLSNVSGLHTDITDALSRGWQATRDLQDQTNRVNAAVAAIDGNFSEAVDVNSNATDLADAATTLLQSCLEQSAGQRANTTLLCNQVKDIEQNVLATGQSVMNASSEASSRLTEALQHQSDALREYDNAASLSRSVNEVTVQQLQDLLALHQEEKRRETVLTERLANLTRDMEELESNFNAAASRLESCYVTP